MPRSTQPHRRRLPEWLLAAGLYGALTFWFLIPDPHLLANHLPSDLGDPLLNLFFLKWSATHLGVGFEGFWDAPFFHPASGVMALSDHLLGPAAIVLVLTAGLDLGYVSSYNVLFLSSFWLGASLMFWTARRQGMSFPAALVAGSVFAFNPYRWDQAPHLQILLSQWLPFGSLALLPPPRRPQSQSRGSIPHRLGSPLERWCLSGISRPLGPGGDPGYRRLLE